MQSLSPAIRAGQGIFNAWSELFRLWGQLMPSVPSLAPYWLDQNIFSSLISGGHFSVLATTVNQQETQAPELEEQIVTKVASYGKQLGRLVEAVDVLAKHSKDPAIEGDERLALEELRKLATDITTARERFAEDHLDQILKSITQLGRPKHVNHFALHRIRALVDQLDQRS